MNKITFRELQTRIPSDLPVVITRYGKPIAKLVKIDEDISNTNVTAGAVRDNKPEIKGAVRTNVTATNVTAKTFVKCFLPGCMKEATDEGYFWNDDDWVKKDMCRAHAKKSSLAYESGF